MADADKPESTRVAELRRDLDALYERGLGDPGLTLTRATKLQHAAVTQMATEMPLDEILAEMATTAAIFMGAAIQQQGLRPADYWKDAELAETVTKRLAKAMGVKSEDFKKVFQEGLKGQG